MSERAIGIFDSGIGGLTVCKAIHDLLPGENIIYFGDTARFPYGTRSKETIIRYSGEITGYLISRNVKMIVVACNTASAAALDFLRGEVNIPVVGVIEAGVRAACKRIKNRIIGVIGTRATINSLSYVKAIRQLDPEIKIFQQQATLFVPLIEEGIIDSEITRLTVKNYLQELYEQGVRTLILGCTHFPLLKKTINDIYSDLDLVDTGIEIAAEVEKILKEKNLAIKDDINNKGTIELYASDITETLERLKEMFFGHNDTSITKLVING